MLRIVKETLLYILLQVVLFFGWEILINLIMKLKNLDQQK